MALNSLICADVPLRNCSLTSVSMCSADWRRRHCWCCSRPTACRCGCAAACMTCAASDSCHTRTAGARLASPAELHHVAAAAFGTNSIAHGWLWPAFHIVVSAKYRPHCRSPTTVSPVTADVLQMLLYMSVVTCSHLFQFAERIGNDIRRQEHSACVLWQTRLMTSSLAYAD